MDWTMIGWREGVFLLVALFVLYIVALLVRLTRVGRRPPLRQEPETPLVRAAMPDSDEKATAAEAGRAALHFEWDEVADVLGGAANGATAASPTPVQPEPAPRAGGFGEHLAEHLARSETETEVRRLRAEIESMRAELEELRAARRVSPQYAEAMELSQRGLTAQDVADQLGISLAEAELVHALSRGDRDFDLGDEDGAERNASNDGIDGIDGTDRAGRQRSG